MLYFYALSWLPSSPLTTTMQGPSQTTTGSLKPTTPRNCITWKEAKSAVIHWLHNSFEEDQESTVPRAVLYGEFEQFCYQSNIEPCNKATFGKLIRAVFNVKTRRLGTRGHSRYHYFGLRARTTGSSSISATAASSTSAAASAALSASLTALPTTSASATPTTAKVQLPQRSDVEENSAGGTKRAHRVISNPLFPNQRFSPTQTRLPSYSPTYEQHSSPQEVEALLRSHHLFCQKFLSLLSSLNFSELEKTIAQHYTTMDTELLDKDNHAVQNLLLRDKVFYQSIHCVFYRDCFEPKPQYLHSVVQNFVILFGRALSHALQDFPTGVANAILTTAQQFLRRLKRVAAINIAVCLLRGYVFNATIMSNMLDDFVSMDASSLFDEYSLEVICTGPCFHHTLASLKDMLKQPCLNPRLWAEWICRVALQMLQSSTASTFPLKRQEVILKMSFALAMFMRRLSLSSQLSAYSYFQVFFLEVLTYFLHERSSMSLPTPSEFEALWVFNLPSDAEVGSRSEVSTEQSPSMAVESSTARLNPIATPTETCIPRNSLFLGYHTPTGVPIVPEFYQGPVRNSVFLYGEHGWQERPNSMPPITNGRTSVFSKHDRATYNPPFPALNQNNGSSSSNGAVAFSTYPSMETRRPSWSLESLYPLSAGLYSGDITSRSSFSNEQRNSYEFGSLSPRSSTNFFDVHPTPERRSSLPQLVAAAQESEQQRPTSITSDHQHSKSGVYSTLNSSQSNSP